jgi:HEPN domain-containing protein
MVSVCQFRFRGSKIFEVYAANTPEIICYHCQQSGEKYLKGFIAFNGGEIRRTHDLIILNQVCIRYNKRFEEIIDDCINLTDYGIQTRYPFELEINEKDMNMAIESATKIQKFVMQFIK